MGTHYSFSQDANQLRDWAKDTAKVVVRRAKKEKFVPAFFYRGMSGCAFATALMLALPKRFAHRMFYIRKSGEDSHGGNVEWAFNSESTAYENVRYIFVDDFIDCGDTFRACYSALNHRLDKFGTPRPRKDDILFLLAESGPDFVDPRDRKTL